MVEYFPFVLSLSKHEFSFFSILLEDSQKTRIQSCY